MAEPITTAATVISAASSLRSLLGGGSKQPSVHQGWRVQGTLTRDGLTGTNTAWDQKGNTWGGAVESGDYYGSIFREYLGDLDAPVPVDITVSAAEGYNAGLIRQLRDGLQAIVAEVRSYAPPVTPIAEPILPTLFPPAANPPSLFNPDPVADTPAAQTVPAEAIKPSDPAAIDAWWGEILELFSAPPAGNTPSGDPMTAKPIVPQAFQQPGTLILNQAPGASTTRGTASTTTAPAAAAMPSYAPLAIAAVLAVLAVKGLS
jgi:hypothetical protein